MKINKICAILTIVLAMSSCSYNDKTNNKETNKIPVDSANAEIGDISSFLEKNGYDQKFILSDDININKFDKLYNIKLKQYSDYEKNFPSIYKKLFDKDFESESGYESVDQLPKRTNDTNERLSFFIDDYSILEGVSYIDYGSASNELEYTTSLNVGKSGFIYYENKYDLLNEYGYKKLYDCSKVIPEGDRYDLVSGESCSVQSACEFADSYICDILHSADPSFEYHPSHINIKSSDDDKNIFEIDIQKYYKGIPFTDCMIGQYDKGSKRTKPMYYSAAMCSHDSLTMLSVPFGLEEIVSAEEIVDPVISLEGAFDILDNELASNIRLKICDIKMMYYNEYDASDVEEAQLLDSNKEQMTREQDLAAGFPELVGGREYTCYPVWAFIIGNEPIIDDNGNYSYASSNDYIYVNIQTGEIINYLGRTSMR